MRLFFAMAAALLGPAVALAQPAEVTCPRSRLDEIQELNRDYQKQGARAQIMTARCDKDGQIEALTLVRLLDGQLFEWRPAEGKPALAPEAPHRRVRILKSVLVTRRRVERARPYQGSLAGS